MTEVKLRTWKVLPVLMFLAAWFFLGFTTDTSPDLVIIGLLPSLLYLILLFVFNPNLRQNHIITFLSPAILSMAFMLLWYSNIPTINQMNGPVIALLNVILSYAMIPFFITWIKKEKKVKVEDDEGDFDLDEEENTEELQYLRESIAAYKQASHADAAELARLRHNIELYEKKSRHDAESVYRMREALAAHEQQAIRYARELQALRDALNSHAETDSEDKDEVNQLRHAIAQYEHAIEQSNHEIAHLRKAVAEYAHELKVTKENMPRTLRSIEDKCKAINFVIGRVYADKKGGSKELREQISIPRELYNAFSALVRNPKKVEAESLLDILGSVMERLTILEQHEHGFLDIGEGWVDVRRTRHDTILDILANNDEDPVREYHAEAKEICEKLVNYIKNN